MKIFNLRKTAEEETFEVDIPVGTMIGFDEKGNKFTYIMDEQKMAELGVSCHDLVHTAIPEMGEVGSEHSDVDVKPEPIEEPPVAVVAKPDEKKAPAKTIINVAPSKPEPVKPSTVAPVKPTPSPKKQVSFR